MIITWQRVFSRDIFQRVPQLDAEVLDVAPLSFLHRLTRQLDVINRQLGLVKQPLDDKHRAYTGTVYTPVRQPQRTFGE